MNLATPRVESGAIFRREWSIKEFLQEFLPTWSNSTLVETFFSIWSYTPGTRAVVYIIFDMSVLIATSLINNEIDSDYKYVGVTEKSVPGHKCPRPRYIFVKKKSVPDRECPRHFARTI